MLLDLFEITCHFSPARFKETELCNGTNVLARPWHGQAGVPLTVCELENPQL